MKRSGMIVSRTTRWVIVPLVALGWMGRDRVFVVNAQEQFENVLAPINMSHLRGLLGACSANVAEGFTSRAGSCTFTCPMGALTEGETCGQQPDQNGGCNDEAGGFPRETIACGETYCGTVQATGGVRDLDWYEIDLTSADVNMDGTVEVTLTINGSAPVGVIITSSSPNPNTDCSANGDFDCPVGFECTTDGMDELPDMSNDCGMGGAGCLCNDGDPEGCSNPTVFFAATASCLDEVVTVCLNAEPYWLMVTTAELDANGDLVGIFDGYDCASTQNDYYLTVNSCADTCGTGACCTCGGGCLEPLNGAQCFDSFGEYLGNMTTCAGQGGNCAAEAHGCTGATPITCDSVTQVDLTDAAVGNNPADPDKDNRIYSCGAAGNDPAGTAWFSFVATDTSALIETCDSTGNARNSILAAYEGECCNAGGMQPLTLREIGCGDDECGFTEFLSRFCVQGLTPGNTYYIQISNWDEDVNGVYDLEITCPCVGACCDLLSGTCNEGAAPSACDVNGQDFRLGETCADFNPPCGVGACCNALDGACTEGILDDCCPGAMIADECPNDRGFYLGAVCDTALNQFNLTCNIYDSCLYNSGDVDDPNDGSAGLQSQFDVSNGFVLARADNFEMKGTNGNLCEITDITFNTFHIQHDDPFCLPGGGGTSGCMDDASDYDGIHVMISPDDFFGGEGPICEPTQPVDGTWTCTDTRVPDEITDVEPDGWMVRLDDSQLVTDGMPPVSGDWWEFQSGSGASEQNKNKITIHFDPTIEIEKNKKHWLSLVPEVSVANHYDVVWSLTDEWNGNPSQVWSSPGTLEWQAVDVMSVTSNLQFRINGQKPSGCGGCQLHGDVVPDNGDGTFGNCIVDVDDVLRVLNNFGDDCTNAPETNIVPCGEVSGQHPCPDGVTDVDDVIAVLNAFGGFYSCDHPCPPGPCCDGVGGCTNISKDECSGIWLGLDTCGFQSPGTNPCPTCAGKECPQPLDCYRCLPDGMIDSFTLDPSDLDYPDCYAAGGFPDVPACYEWDEPVDNDPPHDCSACGMHDSTIAYPVHLFSGEKYEQIEDLRIPGRGFDFVLTRTYRNQVERQTVQGYNWDTAYNIYFRQEGGRLVLYSGDLRQDEFQVYQVEQDRTVYQRGEYLWEVSVANSDGTITTRHDDGMTWTFRPLDGTSVEGKILMMEDRNGNAMTFEYDGSGRLWKVRDTLNNPGSDNRVITYAYNGNGYLSSVTDWIGRQVKYEYYNNGDADGSAGDLKSVTYPTVTGTPNGNDFPQGKTWIYKYYESQAHPDLNHNLRSITDGKGQEFKVVVYGSTPGVDFDKVISQQLGGDFIHYTYVPQVPSGQNYFAELLTIVNDRVGNVSHHFYDAGHRETMVREYTGRAPDPAAATTLTENLPTGKLRPEDPSFFETRRLWDTNTRHAYRRWSNGQSDLNLINSSDTDPRKRGNVLQRFQRPSPADTQGTPTIVESFAYLDGFGGCCGGGGGFVTSHVDGRGNETMHDYDPATGDCIKTTHRLVTQGVLGGGNQLIEETWQYNAFGQPTTYVNPTGRVDSYSYYDSGPMTGYLGCETVDAANFTLTTCYEYDAVGNVIKVIDPRGHDTQYTVNELNQIVRETSREVTTGSGLRYRRDSFYDDNNNMVRQDVENIDDSGTLQANAHFTTINEFDILNDRTRTCQENGSYYVPRSPDTSKLDCTGLPASEFLTTEYEYDKNKNRTLIRLGEAVEGWQTNNVVETRYDERDLVFQEIRGSGATAASTTQYDYDTNRNTTRMTVGVGSMTPRIHTYSYNGLNRVIAANDPEGNVATYAYDNNNNQTRKRVDGERVEGVSGVNVRLFEMIQVYDAMDRPIIKRVAFFDDVGGSIADGEVTTQTFYDPASNIIRITDDNGHNVNVSYDTANRRSLVTDSKGNQIRYEQANGQTGYDANSNVIAITEVEKSDLANPDQTFTTLYMYDNLDRRISTTDNVGNASFLGFDSRNNPTVRVDALSNEVRYVYDGINRLTSSIHDMDNDGADGDGTDITTAQTWDDTSRLIAQLDDNNNPTRYAYDELNRRIATRMADGTIDQVGSGMVAADWPDGASTPNLTNFTSGFDVHDNAILTTDASSSVVASVYDLLNRLASNSIAPGPGVADDMNNGTTFETYQYDGLSRRVRAEDNDSIVAFKYDSLGNILEETLTLAAGSPNESSGTIQRSYDGVGNQLSCTYPGGRVITRTYDEVDRKKTISDGVGMIATYDFVGFRRVERRTYGNGTQTDYTYDGITGIPNPTDDFGVKRIIQTTHTRTSDSAILDDRTYKWDPMYNKTQRKDERIGGPRLTHDYLYDDIYRLTQTEVRNGVGTLVRDTDYSLDGVGNRTNVSGAPDPGAYTMNSGLPEPADLQMNQYTATPFDSRLYDKRGNLIQVPGQRTMVYDYRNQMVQHTKSGITTLFSYDPLGRRIERVVDATGSPTTTRYFYDNWQVCEEQDDTGATNATYVYGQYIDEVLNMQRDTGGDPTPEDYYYHSDDLYNVMAMTNASGSVVERYEYADYGVPINPTTLAPISGAPSSIGNPYLFTGRRYDPETAWYYYRTRYLDPHAGRFTARDVIGIWGDFTNFGNGTAYVANSPLRMLDPLGLSVCCKEIKPRWEWLGYGDLTECVKDWAGPSYEGIIDYLDEGEKLMALLASAGREAFTGETVLGASAGVVEAWREGSTTASNRALAYWIAVYYDGKALVNAIALRGIKEYCDKVGCSQTVPKVPGLRYRSRWNPRYYFDCRSYWVWVCPKHSFEWSGTVF